MDWRYLWLLLKGVFGSAFGLLLSLPSYLSIVIFIIPMFPEIGKWKMTKIRPILRKHRVLICMGLLLSSVILTSHSLYVNKPLQLATPDELIPSVLQDKTIRTADLVREDAYIRRKTFTNCHIYGPALIALRGGVFTSNTIKSLSEESAFVEVTNRAFVGAIVFENCAINNCTFHRISFIGSAREIARYKKGITIQ